MIKRVISGVVILITVIAICIFDNNILESVIITSLALVGIYEYNKAFKNVGYKPISWVGYVSCFTIFTMGGILTDTSKLLIIKVVLPVLLMVIFMYIVLTKFKRTIVDIAITLFSLLYIPFMLSFLKLILMMDHGKILIWFVFMGASASDTFAYLIR